MKDGFLVLALACLMAAPAVAAPPAVGGIRSGVENNRASRIPRASDPSYIPRAPQPVRPKLKAVPPADPGPIPRYGRPKPAIERIPQT